MVMLPKRHVHALTPRTCEYDLIWKKGHCRCNEIKDLEMIVDFLGGPISNDKCPYKTQKKRYRHWRRLRDHRGRD